MENLTATQQKMINSLAAGKKIKSPHSQTGNALRRMGLVKFACFFGWFLTGEGMQHVTKEAS
ncbi:hypothetical protein [Erwinia rhapontici]|uniref:hypothetical protein n=1 Tax=Erwinia rhapontici TaxID=55212 RepID=UPI0013319FC5|nr:hypothetical protein [Erwinia rhapontici]MBP2156893.1 hypothetical protein [Erwinia rhapontici]